MSIFLKSNEFNYKDPETGEYIGVNAVAERTTIEQINAISAAGAAAQALFPETHEATDTLAEDFAPAYNNTTTAYNFGDYCTYQYKLYRCKVDNIPLNSEGFVADHWTLVDSGIELNELKNNLQSYEELNTNFQRIEEPIVTIQQGGLSSSTGGDTDDSSVTFYKRLRNVGYIESGSGYLEINVPEDLWVDIYLYTRESTSGYQNRYPRLYQGKHYIKIDFAYFRMCFGMVYSVETLDPNYIPADFVIVRRIFPTDTNLELNNVPADASIVGNMFNKSMKISSFDGSGMAANQTDNTICRLPNTDASDLPEELSELSQQVGWLFTCAGSRNKIQIYFFSGIDFEDGPTIYYRFYSSTSGGYGDWFKISGQQDLLKSQINILYQQLLVSSELLTYRYFKWNYGKGVRPTGEIVSAKQYVMSDLIPINGETLIQNLSSDVDSDDKSISFRIAQYASNTFVSRVALNPNEYYLIPENIDSIRINYLQDSADSSITMSPAKMNRFFKCKIVGFNTEPSRYSAYVAYGASTTFGSVHGISQNVDGDSPSQYPPPNYIADHFDMECRNMGVGSTGFISRATSGDRENFMDRIYNHSGEFTNAKLVTITFGYGNDRSAGLAPGEYDDYYPYDEDDGNGGNYHPPGKAGVQEMLDKGATLMGCLNWCIRWINTHYPQAQLVLIFTAPSANKDRTIHLESQQEDRNVAPYKLRFTDPYTNLGTEANRGIKKISEELQKLKAALNIPIIDNFFDGCAFSWWSTYANNSITIDPDNPVELIGQPMFSLFSTNEYTDYWATSQEAKSDADIGSTYQYSYIDTTSGETKYSKWEIIDTDSDGYSIRFHHVEGRSSFVIPEQGTLTLTWVSGGVNHTDVVVTEANGVVYHKWNSHPNNAGYNMYGRFLTGQVSSMFSNEY